MQWIAPTNTSGRGFATQCRMLGLAVLLLAASSGLAPRASAQAEPDKTDKTIKTATPEKSDKKFVPMIGDDAIDPTQPLKPGFIVSVTVVGEPDPSGTYPVDPGGNVSIKYAGIMTAVSVKGKTPTEAAEAIRKFLTTYIKNPQVTVTIIQIPRPVVFVGGAVKNSGQIIVTPETTLVELLSKAEWTENADLTQVRIKRSKVSTAYNFDRYAYPKTGETPDETQNPILQDKDQVFVNFKRSPGLGTISVFGDVDKVQQNIPLPPNSIMTVREAINLVGGTKQTANRRAVIIRRPSLDRPLVIDLDKAEQGDIVNNIELRPDDSIYVEKLENNAYVTLNGGFIKPGKLVFDKRTTLVQAINEAGGVAPFAKEKEGVIFRYTDNDAKKTTVIPFNFAAIRKGKAGDIDLQPGDSISIGAGTAPAPKANIFSILSGLGSAAFFLDRIRNF